MEKDEDWSGFTDEARARVEELCAMERRQKAKDFAPIEARLNALEARVKELERQVGFSAAGFSSFKF